MQCEVVQKHGLSPNLCKHYKPNANRTECNVRVSKTMAGVKTRQNHGWGAKPCKLVQCEGVQKQTRVLAAKLRPAEFLCSHHCLYHATI